MKEEDKYQAEDDARMLMRYQELMNDKKRMGKAKEELKKKMEEVKGALKV